MTEMLRCDSCGSEIIKEYNEKDGTSTYVCSYCGQEHSETRVANTHGL